jgi:hypothetical protein
VPKQQMKLKENGFRIQQLIEEEVVELKLKE